MIAGTMAAVALHNLLPASASPADEESCFASAINSARTAAGVAPLSIQGDLLRISRVWSQTMATAGHIFHNTNIVNLVPSNWQTVGENVGVGPTCDSIAQAFMNSPEHKKNILDPAFTTVGVGVVDSSDGTVWVTEDFMGTGAALPAPVVARPTPTPKVTVPEPKVTTPAPKTVVAASSPHHTEPAPPAKPRPSVPAPSPSPSHVTVVEKPTPRPSVTPIPRATPILDQIVTIPGDKVPGAAPTAGPAHPSRGVFSAIGSFFSHLL
jgi:Cysteine-rich secretory protein family